MQFIGFFFPVIVFVSVALLAIRGAERSLYSDEPLPPFALASCVLFAVSLWTVLAVALLGLTQPPGSTGPVQLAVRSAGAMTVFDLRGATLMSMLLVPVVSALLGLIAFAVTRQRPRPRWCLLAVFSYLLAWAVLFVNPWFWPQV